MDAPLPDHLPELLNRRDFPGGRLPPRTKAVDRNTPFGNRFHIGVDGNRDEVIDKFEAWAAQQPLLIARAKRELRGFNLACWCHPKRCHGLFWLKVANA